MTNEIKSPLKNALCELKKLNIKITKDVKNTFYKSNYADLAGILDAVEATAATFGIVVISKIQRHETGLELYTKVSHKDSDEIEDSIFPVFGNKPQEIGSSVTYARRYNIQSLLNLAAEDDDGNKANESEPTKIEPKKVYATAAAKKFDGKAILAAFDNCKSSDELDEIWANHLGAINHFKTATGADADFYTQIVERGKSLRAQFAMMESAGA